MKRNNVGGIGTLLIFGVMLGAGNAQATDGTWTNNASGNWSTAANWKGAIADGAGALADFSTVDLTANRTVTNDSDRSIGRLIFGDLVSSGANGFDWTLTTNSSGNTLTLDNSGSAPTITVSNRTTTITCSLIGTSGFTKLGSGTLALSAKSRYTGNVAVNEGTLSISSGSDGIGCGLGSNVVGRTVTVAAGATLASTLTDSIDFYSTTVNNLLFNIAGTWENNPANTAGIGFQRVDDLTLQGATINDRGNHSNNGYNGIFLVSVVTISNGASIYNQLGVNNFGLGIGATTFNVVGASDTFTVNGAINKPVKAGLASFGILTKTGAGTMVLTGTNTYDGGTTISNGVLAVSNNLAMGTSTVRLAGGTLGAAAGTWAVTNVVNVQAASSLGASGTLALMGNVTNNSALTVVSGGVLFNGSKTGTGALTVSGGYLGGTGTVYGVVTNARTITAADTNTVGTLTMTNLVMASGSTVLFNYNDTTNDVVVVNGPLSLPAVATVNVVRVLGTLPPANPAVVFKASGGISGSVSGWAIRGDTRPNSQLIIRNNQVQLASPTGLVIILD